jgi:hypothetical protein
MKCVIVVCESQVVRSIIGLVPKLILSGGLKRDKRVMSHLLLFLGDNAFFVKAITE